VITARSLRRGDAFHQPWLPVVYADQCRGFVVPCGNEFRVFDVDETPLGTFATEAEAVASTIQGRRQQQINPHPTLSAHHTQ
jgi:hypothetical protein